jgi:hypothetical protein
LKAGDFLIYRVMVYGSCRKKEIVVVEIVASGLVPASKLAMKVGSNPAQTPRVPAQTPRVAIQVT